METGKPFLAFPYSKQVRAIQYLTDGSNSDEVMNFLSNSKFSIKLESNGYISLSAKYPIRPSKFIVIEETRTGNQLKVLSENEFDEYYEFGTSIII